ncbi:MAG: type III-B CRISPR-associated protein Cas10/Cmr2 [Isosphaeraceae bacterium]|jgi:CRISPR-associated protein Cmr2|nr:MAG: type III-B CRISPR-associated protein Cas10/Cmr2 [Isosphaeraceae bacterium]
MSYLLAISVGPVQEFIAAARRTRDLWFGSHLLSEISRAVAKSVESQGGTLIFPASSDAESVANVVLAKLDAADPRVVSATAKKAAQDRWLAFAEETQREASGVICPDIWDDQVDDVIEFYSAWVMRTTDYKADRARVMRLLAGRKNCRDFLPAKGRAGVPKSSLDGQRESVLKPPTEWPQRFRARVRIREGEQLDVVGVVKRVAGGNRPYPSVARVAADPWIRGNGSRLEEVISACNNLGDQVIRPLDVEAYPQFAAFPFEGTAVYPSRHHEMMKETEVTIDDLRPLRDALARLPEPEPYLAVLVADGDKMGEALSRLESPDAHRDISQQLADFAVSARTILDKHNNGVLVYAGGDDVLGFVPVDRCLSCARQLHNRFAELLGTYGSLTLSVGIAIGHFMENLEDLLEYGRAAEKHAKQPDRDGLAIHLHKRGGTPIRFRARWEENPDSDILQWAQLQLADLIPSKLPYDLRNMARIYEDWPSTTRERAIQQDIIRVIRDKQPRSGEGRSMSEIAKRVYKQVNDPESLSRFVEELLVARQITTALRQAGYHPEHFAEVES